MQFIQNIYRLHRQFWKKEQIVLLLQALALFVAALFVQRVAYQYVDGRAVTTYVGDLLLDNLPTVNLDIFIVQGALAATFLVAPLFLMKPRYLSFALKTLAIFIIARSFFISLTHLGVNLQQITLNTERIGFGLYDILYNGKNDFFFSGHVGATFLLALIFWKEKIWRYVFLAASVIFGISMILAHMHYSIDVFAAPFITYSIYAIARKIFSKDFSLIT